MTILKTFLVATLLTLAAFAQNYNCTYTTFPVTGSGAAGPVGEGLNGSDIAVGWYQDTSNLTHGFRRLPNGTVKTFQVSGAQHTWLFDINDSGTAVGRASLPSGNGYGFKIEGGKFTVIRYPGATSTGAIGINNNGDIVGVCGTTGAPGSSHARPALRADRPGRRPGVAEIKLGAGAARRHSGQSGISLLSHPAQQLLDAMAVGGDVVRPPVRFTYGVFDANDFAVRYYPASGGELLAAVLDGPAEPQQPVGADLAQQRPLLVRARPSGGPSGIKRAKYVRSSARSRCWRSVRARCTTAAFPCVRTTPPIRPRAGPWVDLRIRFLTVRQIQPRCQCPGRRDESPRTREGPGDRAEALSPGPPITPWTGPRQGARPNRTKARNIT